MKDPDEGPSLFFKGKKYAKHCYEFVFNFYIWGKE